MDTSVTPKRLVRGAFESADLPRLPFIPWVFTHAARLQQVPVRRAFSDPTQYVKCLQNARKLYGYDAIISSFDASLEIEICGCPVTWRGDYETPVTSPNPVFDLTSLKEINVESAGKTGRFGTVTESLRRINVVSGASLALAAVVTGPLTMTAGLTGGDLTLALTEKPDEVKKAIEDAAGFVLRVVQSYCQMQLDIIAIADRLTAVLPAEHLPWLQSIFSPIVNNVRFYNAFSVLLPGELSTESLKNLIELGFDGIVAAGVDTGMWTELRSGRSCVLGKAIPSQLLKSGQKELQSYLEAHLPVGFQRGVFLTTDWEVPADTPPENIHFLMKKMSEI